MVKQYNSGVCSCYRVCGLCTQASELITCGSRPVMVCAMHCVKRCGALIETYVGVFIIHCICILSNAFVGCDKDTYTVLPEILDPV
jgi:hypothetical protein